MLTHVTDALPTTATTAQVSAAAAGLKAQLTEQIRAHGGPFRRLRYGRLSTHVRVEPLDPCHPVLADLEHIVVTVRAGSILAR